MGKATWYTGPIFRGQDLQTGQCLEQGGRLMAFYTHVAQGCEVEVDIEAGKVEVLKFVSALDVRKAINPKLVEGQIEGGIMMGIGHALYERMILEGGKVLNANFRDYKVPTSEEVPTIDNMVPIIVETRPHKDGPYGAKGVGEAVTITPVPAIANAIYNAIGIRFMEHPITSERVLTALRDRATKGGEE